MHGKVIVDDRYRDGMTTGSRLAVVSGGGTGIGKQIARMFASQGDRVVILGRQGRCWLRPAPRSTKPPGRIA